VIASSGAIILPRLIQRQIDQLAQSFLQPQQTIDFSRPKEEPALIPPDSISWRMFKNPVAVFIGGVTAVLLEFAEPRVRDGVWQHSRFRTDPLTRLRRTGLAAMVTVYGPRSQAEAMIARVVRRHERVTGWTSAGEPYRANDPVLLRWVQATASFGFTEAYHAYVRSFTADERLALFAEALPSARLYGATGAPASQAELDALFEAMRPRLVASPIIFFSRSWSTSRSCRYRHDQFSGCFSRRRPRSCPSGCGNALGLDLGGPCGRQSECWCVLWR